MFKVIKSLELSVAKCVLKNFYQNVKYAHGEVFVKVVVCSFYFGDKFDDPVLFSVELVSQHVELSV